MVKKTNKKTTKKVEKNIEKNKNLKLECCGVKDESCNDEKVEVYVCPRCQSVDVGYHFGLKNLFGVIPKMKCKNCGLISAVFPKWVIDKEKLTNKTNKISKSKIEKKKDLRVNYKREIEEEYCPNCRDHVHVEMKDGSINTFVCDNCKFEIKKGKKKR